MSWSDRVKHHMSKGYDMSKRKKSKPVKPPTAEPMSVSEIPPQTGEEIQVQYDQIPPPPPPNQKIHPRRKLPPVPEGEEVPDKNPSPPVEPI